MCIFVLQIGLFFSVEGLSYGKLVKTTLYGDEQLLKLFVCPFSCVLSTHFFVELHYS